MNINKNRVDGGINYIEIQNRYSMNYNNQLIPVRSTSLVRKSVDTYEKYIPLIKLNENPLLTDKN